MVAFLWGLFGSAAFSAAALAVAAWFSKPIAEWFKQHVKHKFDDQLALQQNVFDRHLAAMSHSHELEVERLRADLRIDAFRNETTFARLHEKRAGAVAAVFSELNQVRIALADYANVGGQPERWPELRKAVFGALERCYSQFNPQEIYLPAPIAEKIRNYLKDTKINLLDFTRDVDNGGEDVGRFYKTWQEVSERLNGSSKVLFEQLRDEFRRLLGDEAPPAADAGEAK